MTHQMSKDQSRAIDVYHVVISQEKLRAMSSDERAFLLLLGYAANQVSMLQKLLMFSMNKLPSSELEQTLCAAQTQMILRLAIGTLHESWLMIKKRFVGSSIGRAYLSRLDEGGLAALEKLKRMDGKSNLISSIRNNYSFHFPDDTAEIDAAFFDACSDPNSDGLWNLYFSKYGFNSQYLVSDLIVVHGITKLTKEADPNAGQQRIMDDVGETIVNLFEFTKAFFAAAWLKNFGTTLDAKELIKIVEPPPIWDVSIPFFIDMDADPPAA
jgi:hypothetical protein